MGYHSFQQAGPYRASAIFDLAIQILAIFGNSLVLIAVINVRIGLVGFRRFLISLLANHIFLCVSQVLITIYLEFDAKIDSMQSCIGAFLDSLKLFAVFAALFNLCGMSLDHMIGISKPLKYDYLMSTKLAKLAPFLIWIFAFIFGFADIPIAALVYYIYIYHPSMPEVSYLDLYKDLVKTAPSPKVATINFQKSFVATELEPPNLMDFGPLTLNLNKGPAMAAEADPFQELNTLLDQMQNNEFDLQDQETDWCLISHSYKLYWDHILRLVCTLVAFCFLIGCYSHIFAKIRTSKARQMINGQRSGSGTSSPKTTAGLATRRKQTAAAKRGSSRKFIMTTLSLFGVFAICWFPFVIVEMSVNPLLRSTSPGQAESSSFIGIHSIQHLFNSLFLSYPLLDAIICSVRVPSVRRYIHLMFLMPIKCQMPRRDSSDRRRLTSIRLSSAPTNSQGVAAAAFV